MKPRRRVLEDDLPEMDCIDIVDMREELDMREDSSLPSESRELASVLEPWEVVEAAERARAGSGFAPIACDGAASGECGRFSVSADMAEEAESKTEYKQL